MWTSSDSDVVKFRVQPHVPLNVVKMALKNIKYDFVSPA